MRLTVVIDNKNCANWHAPFIGRDVRAKLDFARVREPMAMIEVATFPTGIPGQCLSIDTDAKEGRLLEPLRSPEHRETAEKAGRKLLGGEVGGRLKMDPAETVVELKDPRDAPTWLYWMKRAVESGIAKVVEGALPNEEQTKGARKSFILPEPVKDEHADLRKQELAAKMAVMSKQQREEFDRILAGMN